MKLQQSQTDALYGVLARHLRALRLIVACGWRINNANQSASKVNQALVAFSKPAYQTISVIFLRLRCCCAIAALSSRIWRVCRRVLSAFCEATSLPFALLGPVDLTHGCHNRIRSACCLRRSKVQPFAIVLPQ